MRNKIFILFLFYLSSFIVVVSVFGAGCRGGPFECGNYHRIPEDCSTCPGLPNANCEKCECDGWNTYVLVCNDITSYSNCVNISSYCHSLGYDCGYGSCSWYRYACSGTSCVWSKGSGNDTCSSSCTQGWGAWSACSNSCGDGTQSRTCNCSGDCCTGCSDGEGSGSCGSTQTKGCCVCNSSCACDASEPNYQTQCAAPYCGQYVCHTTYGQRCGGSSCAQSCSKTNCGNCADWRSSSLTIDSSKVHDLPLSILGHARDNNGATDGVEDVHVYFDCPSGNCSSSNFWTSFSANNITIKANDPNAGSFNDQIKTPAMFDLYNKLSRNGENHTHTLYFFAVQTEGGTCGNWLFATKTINLTNASPQNQSLKLCQQNPENCFCGTGLDSCQDKPILSYTTNNILRLKAIFSDTDQFPTQPVGYIRESDIDEAYIIFDSDNDENNGFFYRIKYKDDVNNSSYFLAEDGGTKANLIAIQNHSRSITGSYNLNLTIDLDFTLYPKNEPFTSNIYLKVKDFAGKEIKTEMVSTTFTAAPYWYKLKNASLNKRGKLENYLNNSPTPYDSDDTSEKLLIIGSGGSVLVESATGNSLGFTPIENYVSSNRWLKQGYSLSTTTRFFINQYFNYAKSRKLVKYISTVSDSEIESNKVNIYKGNDVELLSDLTKENFVLVLRNNDDTDFVNLRINKQYFNQSKRSQAFLANSVTFSNNTTEANGIFIAFSFNIKDPPLSTYITTPLKITGNLISLEEIVDTTVRRRTDITKPSIFIVFSPQMYLNLLPYLSVSKYDWQQLQ